MIKIKTLIFPLFRNIFFMFILIISLFPFLWALISSFKTNRELLTNPFSMPTQINFNNYINALKMAPINIFYINSLILALSSVSLILLVYSMSAYVFARFTFRFKGPLFMLLTSSILIPGTAIIYPLYMTITQLNLYNTKAGLILIYVAFSLPVSTFILRSYFLSLPANIEEAAMVDGAGFVRIFANIALPVARPGLASAGILAFFRVWNDFIIALTMTTGTSNKTLPVAIEYFNSMLGSDFGALFAAVIMVVTPSIVIYLIMQRQIVAGLTAGAVKG